MSIGSLFCLLVEILAALRITRDMVTGGWSSSEDNVLDLLDPPDLFLADHPGRQDVQEKRDFFLSEGLQRLRNVTLMFRNRKHIRGRRRPETTCISKQLIKSLHRIYKIADEIGAERESCRRVDDALKIYEMLSPTAVDG